MLKLSISQHCSSIVRLTAMSFVLAGLLVSCGRETTEPGTPPDSSAPVEKDAVSVAETAPSASAEAAMNAEQASSEAENVQIGVETASSASAATKANAETRECIVYSPEDRSDAEHEYFGISYVYDGGELEQITYEHLPASTPIHFVVPDGVTGIGPRAFRDCPGLESVAIPNTVNLISASAFQNLAKLKTVSLPVHASIGTSAFEGCTALESVTLTEGGTVAPVREDAAIGECAFASCNALKRFEFPDGIHTIGPRAFQRCDALESTAIPNTVNLISYDAFESLPNLKTVTIPVHASIESGAFKACLALESVTLTKGGTVAPVREDASIGSGAFAGCPALKRFEFPDGIRTIKDQAFTRTALRTVSIPNSVDLISEEAFYELSSLKTVTIPTHASIGVSAFERCYNLERVTLTEGGGTVAPAREDAAIREHAFRDCLRLEEVRIPDGVTFIGESAFEYCSRLKAVSVPDGVTSIGFRAFQGCSALESVSLPDSLKVIGNKAFLQCTSLKSLRLPERLESFTGAFDLSTTRLEFPQGNTRYRFTPEGALIDAENHVLLAFPSAFEGHFTIPDGITAVAPHAFRSCRLGGVTIPSSVTSLGAGAFAFSGLNEIAIPPSVTAFQADEVIPGITQNGTGFRRNPPPAEDTLAGGLFYNCTNLKRVTLPENMKEIPFAMFAMFARKSSLEEIAIPSGVTVIRDRAFSGCNSLKRVSFPSGLRAIGGSAFDECVNLEAADLPDDVDTIGNFAFLNCTSLKRVILPANMKSLMSRGVFSHCSSLVEVEIPKGLKEIGQNVFYGCPCMESVYRKAQPEAFVEIPDGTTEIDPDMFTGRIKPVSITIPNSVGFIPDAAFQEFDRMISVSIPVHASIGKGAFKFCWSLKSVTLTKGGGTAAPVREDAAIGDDAFHDCQLLSSIEFPEGITSIGERAFMNCHELKEIVIPEGVTIIADNTFLNCYKLERIVLPASLKTIGKSAFAWCPALKEIAIPESVTEIADDAFRRSPCEESVRKQLESRRARGVEVVWQDAPQSGAE